MYNEASFWLVCEADPWPDTYIAIFNIQKATTQSKIGHSKYASIHKALNRAKILQRKYKVKQVRLFFPNRISILIKNVKECPSSLQENSSSNGSRKSY